MKKLYTDKVTFALVMILGVISGPANAQPVFEWVVKMGGADFDQSVHIATDGSGNTYTTGFYNGSSATFGTTTITSAGSSDGFLAKCDPAGNFLWARNLGGDGNDNGTKVTVDKKGNVYVVGGFGSTDFAPDGSTQTFAAASWNNVYVAKYNANGNFRWVKAMGGSDGDYCNGVAVDDNGNVYLTGNYNSPNFSMGAHSNILPVPVSGDAYLVKLDSNGGFIWAKGFGGTDNDEVKGIIIDGADNLYLTGFFNGSANFDPNGTAMLSVAGVSDIFLAKYDTAGNYIWAKRMGGVDDEYGYEVAADAIGNVYVAGAFNGTISFDGTSATLSSSGGRDGILVKYDSAGNYVWSKNIGGANWDEMYGVAVDGGNNVHITGGFQDAVVFGPGATLTSEGGGDVFVAKYDPAGNYTWAKNMGGTGFDRGNGIAVDGSGSIYATGYFLSDPADFNIGGPNGELSPGVADGFIVKFVCGDTTSAQVVFEECGDSFSVNGTVYTASGTYTQVRPNAAGCDSMITIDLTLHPVNIPQIDVNEHILSVVQTYDAYQWIDEDGDIFGATNPTYTVTANGKYSVRTTDENGCEAVSAIYEVTNVSVGNVDGWGKYIHIYPNPANDMIYVRSPLPVSVSLSGIDGRVLLQVSDARAIDMSGLVQGVYLVRITDMEGRLIRTEKVLKR